MAGRYQFLQKSSVLVSPLKKGARAERDSVIERARKEEREQREGELRSDIEVEKKKLGHFVVEEMMELSENNKMHCTIGGNIAVGGLRLGS